jgi:nickel-type superoxide dismutase maturation protease
MRPTLQPGDHLLVVGWFWGRRVRPSDIVVFREPDQQLTFAVKRVATVASNGDVVVHADNPNVSRDSREYGPVPRRMLVGKAIYRYLPGTRRGWL